ncbi:hypothetical protein [Hyperthermus butylicus]|uniref:Uncharacterized protein n=1 Tax=Hyperthermus butylicus (strain DSM 5456 / JCM 9403 / PLM1-5) TaxID=415426 RepID=A2BKJ1_HYPBU|nr:hypothetical protein [Hyperthermus butylicus]ABM80502.1 hypothetical protein Hbut_0645 [Hyperthermus butylicus DSM 5456]
MHEQHRLYRLPELLSFFARTRQFGVLDRIANALSPDQALAALYDALRVFRSSCLSESPDKKCPNNAEELVEKARYEVEKITELLLDSHRAEEGLRLARTAAILALGR